MSDSPVSSITVEGRTFVVYTLGSYVTAYYYVRELGRVNHYDTLRRLQNAIKRALRKGTIGKVTP